MKTGLERKWGAVDRCGREGRIVSDKHITKEQIMRLCKVLCAATAGLVFLSILTACDKGLHEQPPPEAAKTVNIQAPVSPAATKHAGAIQLQAVPDGTAFKLQKTGRLVCVSPKPQGCIRVPKGDTAKVTFKLNASPSWHLTSFTICRASGTEPCKLVLKERADFEITESGTGAPMYPDENGEVDLATLGADLQQFVLDDRNTVAQDYEYVVVACKGEGDEEVCTTTDPPLENHGL